MNQFTSTDTTQYSTFDPNEFVPGRNPKKQPSMDELFASAIRPDIITTDEEYVNYKRLNEIAKAVGEHETDWLEDKYGNLYKAKTIEERYDYEQPRSKAIGYYQIEPPTLETYSKEFLGKKITPQQLKKSPSMQDEFARKYFQRVMGENYGSQGKWMLNEEEAIKSWNIGPNGDYGGQKAKDYLMKVSMFLPPKEKLEAQKQLATKKPETKTKTETKPQNKNILTDAVANLIKAFSIKKNGT